MNRPKSKVKQKKRFNLFRKRISKSRDSQAEQERKPVPLEELREVPEAIRRPEYFKTGQPSSRGPKGRALVKSDEQIQQMREACQLARRIVTLLGEHVKAGVNTDELDAIAHEECIRAGAYPSPLNYGGFPKSICTSINEVICHGIPSPDVVLQDGDIVNCDITVYLNGMHGDCSETFYVGEVDSASKQLVEVTRDCLKVGIRAIKPMGCVRDIGWAIADHARKYNYGVVRAFVGHGIGELFHLDPQVPHYYDAKAKSLLLPGMTLTVEPMINEGTWEHDLLDDQWTAVTKDRLRSAQHEHTILVTKDGPEILTLPAGVTQSEWMR